MTCFCSSSYLWIWKSGKPYRWYCQAQWVNQCSGPWCSGMASCSKTQQPFIVASFEWTTYAWVAVVWQLGLASLDPLFRFRDLISWASHSDQWQALFFPTEGHTLSLNEAMGWTLMDLHSGLIHLKLGFATTVNHSSISIPFPLLPLPTTVQLSCLHPCSLLALALDLLTNPTVHFDYRCCRLKFGFPTRMSDSSSLSWTVVHFNPGWWTDWLQIPQSYPGSRFALRTIQPLISVASWGLSLQHTHW